MATSTRLRGNQGLHLTFDLDLEGAGAPVTMSDDIKTWELTPEDADGNDITFAEALAGLAAAWKFKVTAITSNDAGALFEFLWTNPNKDVAAVLGAWGNAVPSATKPHFEFTLNTGYPPGITNEARTTKEGAEFEKEFEVTVAPVRVTA